MITSRDSYQVWSLAKLKGGLRGTTSSVFIAATLAKLGHAVVLVDADKTAQSAVDWALRVEARGGELPFRVVQWTPVLGILPTFVKEVADRRAARYIIVDVEPTSTVVQQAAAVSDLVVLPTGVDLMELARVAETNSTVAEVNPHVPRPVLLTRVPRAGYGRSRDARTMLSEYGLPVLATEIPQDRERYADVFGYPISDPGAYGDLVDELVDLMGVRP